MYEQLNHKYVATCNINYVRKKGRISATSSPITPSFPASTLRCLPVLPMLDHHINNTDLLKVRPMSCMHIDQPPGIAAPLAKNHTMNPTAPTSTITGGINFRFIKISLLSFYLLPAWIGSIHDPRKNDKNDHNAQ